MSRTGVGISISRSALTSWPISAIGKRGARSSGPTGLPVPGCRTGGGGDGRSATILYQAWGIRSSPRRNFVCSLIIPPCPPKSSGRSTRSAAGWRGLAVIGVENRQARLLHWHRDRLSPVPARPQNRIGRMDNDARVARVRQEGEGLLLDQAIGFPREDAHRRNLVDRRAEGALRIVRWQVDLHGQDLPAGIGMGLDRVAVEIGVKHWPRMHRDRPSLAASLSANPESLVQFLA